MESRSEAAYNEIRRGMQKLEADIGSLAEEVRGSTTETNQRMAKIESVVSESSKAIARPTSLELERFRDESRRDMVEFLGGARTVENITGSVQSISENLAKTESRLKLEKGRRESLKEKVERMSLALSEMEVTVKVMPELKKRMETLESSLTSHTTGHKLEICLAVAVVVIVVIIAKLIH